MQHCVKNFPTAVSTEVELMHIFNSGCILKYRYFYSAIIYHILDLVIIYW